MTGSSTFKRVFDLVVALIVLLVAAPVIALVALAVRRRLGAGVLFRQTRPGLGGRPFQMVKFRTMLHEDARRGLITDEQRLTSFGRWLRATSLDELPALWNVVKGDMSLVGPRPLLMRYLPRYSPAQARRHEVRPGLTGLAQVSGRNALTWEDRLALDVQYVDARSLRGDVAILWRTVLPVLRRDGITDHESATMTEFVGAERTAG